MYLNQSSYFFYDFSQHVTLDQSFYDHFINIVQFYLRKFIVCAYFLDLQGAFVQSFDVDCQQMRWRSIVDDALQLNNREVFIAIAEGIIDAVLRR